jgi:hypothetical protein
VLAVLVALGGGCARRSSATATPWIPAPAPDLGEVVATVETASGPIPIFAAEVAAQAWQTHQSPRAALDQLIAFHLLAERARGKGASPWPPPDADLHKQVLVQRMLERELEPHVRPEDITDAELRVLYDRAHDYFVHARLIEVASLEVPVSRRALPPARVAARQTMTELAAAVQAAGNLTLAEFQALGKTDAWRSRGVRSVRFLQGPQGPHSAKFAAAVAKLATVGETTGLIEDESGVYLARYVADRPAKDQSFDQVRPELRAGFYPRWRQQKFLEWSDRAATGHQVEIRPVAALPVPGS